MLISITGIDESSTQSVGCMKMPGFIVQFASSVVSGSARFVPSSGTAKGCIDQSFYVEINQENITDVQLLPLKAIESVTPLLAPSSFLVVGTVTSLVPLGDLDGQLVTVTARDAIFTLEPKELGSIRPLLGEQITFVAHDLSLWDEAI